MLSLLQPASVSPYHRMLHTDSLILHILFAESPFLLTDGFLLHSGLLFPLSTGKSAVAGPPAYQADFSDLPEASFSVLQALSSDLIIPLSAAPMLQAAPAMYPSVPLKLPVQCSFHSVLFRLPQSSQKTHLIPFVPAPVLLWMRQSSPETMPVLFSPVPALSVHFPAFPLLL